MNLPLWLSLATLATATGTSADGPTEGPMASAAANLLAALDEDQRATMVFPFDAEARFDWHYVPRADRKGLALKAMTPEQRQLAHVLLNASLSRAGYAKTVTVMSLEATLREIERAAGRDRPGYRDPLGYHVTMFGAPSASGDWGWSLEGHHVSHNFTVLDGRVISSTPAFLGANPHRVPSGPRAGLRPLGAEEDLARALLDALDPAQRAVAVEAETPPRDIFTGAEPRVSPDKPTGLAASAMNALQRELLDALIDEYIRNVPGDLAAKRRAQVTEAGGRIHFTWMGSREPGEAHYYRVQAPTFLIEYDNIQNDANHSHTVWRDYDGDFGRDLIAEHHRRHAHR